MNFNSNIDSLLIDNTKANISQDTDPDRHTTAAGKDHMYSVDNGRFDYGSRLANANNQFASHDDQY